jgi:hypothetical protein
MALKLYDVFVSHNRHNKAWVRTFCNFLRFHGLTVFFDEDSIQPGEDVVAAIELALEASRHVILIISPASVASPWVALETAIPAHGDPANLNRTIIPVMLELVPLASLRPFIRRLSIVDLSQEDNRDDRLSYLLKALGIVTSESELQRLWQSERPSGTSISALQVANISDTIAWGWNGDKLLEELIKLDYETIEGLTSDHEGHVAQWAPVFMDHPDTWRLIIERPGVIVGYWHFVPLFEKEMRLAKQGKLLDGDITTDKVRLFELEGQYDIYFVSLCMKAEFKRTFAVSPLLKSLLEVIGNLASQGVFFRDICANAYTASGVSICKSFDFRQLTEHRSHGKIFYRRTYPFPPLKMISQFPDLIKLYGAEFWKVSRTSSA